MAELASKIEGGKSHRDAVADMYKAGTAVDVVFQETNKAMWSVRGSLC